MEREYPLQWPAGQPRTVKRDRGKFMRSITQARVELIKQTQLAGGTDILISSNFGGLSGKTPDDPGVAIYFNRRGKRLGMGCDRWALVAHNLSALANTVEAMRGIDRWGCGHLMEQAFAAFEALPAPATGWRAVLGYSADQPLTVEDVEKLYRMKAKRWHPDAPSGDAEKFKLLTDARDAARKELG